MTTLADIANGVQSSPADENSKPNAFVSALAGIGSGAIKAISKGAKALKPKEFIKMKNAINSELPTKGPSSFSKVGDYLQGVVDEVPESAKDQIIRNMSLSSKIYC